jgi:DNA-binding transcriptional LysR family regulator
LGRARRNCSTQLAKLEVMIGRLLFFRTAREVTLTPVGEQYLTEVSGILHSLDGEAAFAVFDIWSGVRSGDVVFESPR